jgi:hypothetical protein
MNIDISKIDARTVSVKDDEMLVRTNVGGKDVAYTVIRYRDYWDGTRGTLVISVQLGQRMIVSTYPYTVVSQLFERELMNCCSDFEEKIRNLLFSV